jgi:O-antigen/teichoic acid export membrane protein
MGIIARQSIKRSILSLAGSLIGVISLLFIYPLSKDSYGFAQFLISSASFFAIFFSFGSTSLVIRYFPELKEKYSKGFLSVIFSVTFLVIILSTVVLGIFRKTILEFLAYVDFQTEVINDNLMTIYFLSLLIIIIQIIIFQSANFKRIVIPFAIHELSFKIFLPILILLVFLKKIEYFDISTGLLLFYLFSLIFNGIYLKHLGGLSLGKTGFWDLPGKKLKEFFSYMGFSGLNIISENLTTQIDRIMIPLLLNMSSNGVYSIFLFMSNTIAIPSNSLYPIASPVISDSMQKGDMKNIELIYKKTSINSFIAGSFIFILIWTNINDIINIMPDNESISPFINVFLFLCIAKLFDMVTSVNSFILIYSKFYKYNLIFLLLLAFMNVTFNYYFINMYGIVGAALGTMLSVFIYNIMKLIFIQVKFRIHPFSKNSLSIFIILLLTILIGRYLPASQFVILNLFYKSLLISIIYYLLLKSLKIDSEIIVAGESFIISLYKNAFKKR